jgi:hypothetical protein
MQLLPHTTWGTLYLEVNGRMLFQRHWRYRQKAPFDRLPLSGFTCELLEVAQVLGRVTLTIFSPGSEARVR